jgi:phosphoinositide-3-kinase regulatory subunit 4
LRDSHSLDVFHGDIKTENVLVTSWNWLYLSDYSSSFKPTFLPEDNPADFSFYFDISGRRTCYLAPERFLVAGEEPGNRHVNWAMDIFSAGCVIAELFLESPIFTLSQIYKYRKGEYSPEHSQLVKIEDLEIRELILHMIQLEPESRYSAEEYLNFWKNKAFPEYFYSFLHQYMSLMTDPSSGRTKVDAESNNRGETDDRIERVCLDFDKISYFLGVPPRASAGGPSATNPAPRLTGSTLPVKLDLPDGDGDGNQITASSPQLQSDEGVLIFLGLVASNLRTTSKASARIKACDVLLAFAEKLSDEAKLDRVLPYVMILLADRTDSVKVAAIRTLTQLLEMVHVVTPVNAYLFPEYIFPRLQPFIISSKHNPSPMVRAAYASCIASLAQSSLRFLDMIQALRSDTRLTSLIPVGFEPRWTEDATYHNLYDVARIDLLEYFEVHTKALLTDTDASVRRAFLGSVSSLCVFFGNLKANEVILSHLNTYLNDRDWILKCAFFEAVVGVAAYVGSTNLEQYILPLMIQSMTEPEEFVVEKVIRSLAAMADLGLFQRSTTWDLLHITIGFLVHPNIWIREAAVSLVVKSTKFLSVADIFSILTPLIRPYLKVKIVGFSEAELLDALKRPMSRNIYEIVFLWASKTDKGIFWKSASRDAFSLSEPGSHSSRVGRSVSPSMSSQSKNEEDEQWLSRLRNLGMTVEDEFKILALRDYICRVSLRQSRDVEAETTLPLGEIISLSQQGVTPQTVFFDKNLNEKSRNTSLERNTSRTRNPLDDPRPRTIADALLDASTTIERSPSAHRRHIRTRSQLHKEIEIPHPRSIAVESSSSSPAASSPAAAPGSRPMSPPGSDVERHTIHANRRLSSGQESSSTTPTNADTLSLRGLPVQRKSSAINLLNRNDTAKAYAETGTSAANVFGKVDAPVQRSGAPQPSALSHAYERKPTQAVVASRRYRANHSYTGDDPVVLRLLDNVFAENYPTDLFDLGPYVKELDSRQPIPKSNSQNVNKLWKPEGNLVATFGEHSGPVNRIAVPPDHSFFVTASDDSTVKIWDTIRLERNLTPRSRQTHRHSPGARVKALTFVENTYTFVSGATDGSIHAVRIDYQKVNEIARYGKLQLVREYQLPVAENGLQEYAVWMEHFRDEGQSTLLIATNTCRILALDMKTMLPVFTLENPVHHGTPTTFCCDRRHTWLLIGTTHGVLDLWDLRFRVRLKAWGLPGWGYIHRVQLHPIKSRGRWVCVSSSGIHGNEITVWDIEKFRCREVYQAAPLNSSETATPNGSAPTTHHRSSRGTATSRAHRLSARDFEAWPVDEDRPEGMLSRFATTSPAAAGLEAGPPVVGNNGSAAAPTNLAGDRMGTLAFIGGLNTPDDDKAASSNSKLGFIVSAGSDRRIRFWDLANPAGSMIVSGLDAVANGTAASKPQYETTQPGPHLSMVIEHMPRSSGDGAAAAVSKKGASPRPPRSTVISLQQQMLLKSHLDIIQDVAVLRQPYGMIVSVDRAGMVYVFK